MFLSLEKAQRLAEGNRRWVFVHPDDPDLLVKVVKPTARLKFNGFQGVRRRYMNTSPILRELREHIVLRLDNPHPPRFLPKVEGFVDTDLGLGLIVRAERGRDGNYAPTLASLIRQQKITPNILRDIGKFFSELRASTVAVGDLTAKNIVYAATPEEGERFVLIDGLGDKTWLPLSRLRFFRERGKERAIGRIERSLGVDRSKPACRLALKAL